ncbi:MAG: hypothetical protein GYB65_08725 [Chloroflexi bacterium]|nr:hypothetical protein [Chloroflexota bacterium]
MTDQKDQPVHQPNPDPLSMPPMAFIDKVEHDLRGVIGIINGWWQIIEDDGAGDFHQEAKGQIPLNIATLVELVELMDQYLNRHGQK